MMVEGPAQARLPIATVLAMRGAFGPAWQASLAGSWSAWSSRSCHGAFSEARARRSRNGAVFAVWPLLSIVFAAFRLYNVGEAAPETPVGVFRRIGLSASVSDTTQALPHGELIP